MPARLAVIDDDAEVRSLLQRGLAADGHLVTLLADGIGIEAVLDREPHDLALVDVGLPGIDGLTLTRTLRARYDIGIIIISGRSDLTDRVVGLELGADDYVVKPFELREVRARVRSVLRRQMRGVRADGEAVGQVHRFGQWTFDLTARSLRSDDGASVGLTTGEYRLLECFVRRPGRVLSRAFLVEHIHDHDAPVFDRSVDVTVARLRKKLGMEREDGQSIKTVRNGGYVFSAPVTLVR